MTLGDTGCDLILKLCRVSRETGKPEVDIERLVDPGVKSRGAVLKTLHRLQISGFVRACGDHCYALTSAGNAKATAAQAFVQEQQEIKARVGQRSGR